jgi:3-oxosteroid 1-dehydrogenase
VQNRSINPDILIIGSGGASLTAALYAKTHGLTPLIIEKSSKIGGSTCYSGGGLWVPNNGIHPGVTDSLDEALTYMRVVVDGTYQGPASTEERKVAYLESAPKMMAFLRREGMHWVPSLGYSDYYPDVRGGKAGGRSIEAGVFDSGRLGEWRELLNVNPSIPAFTPPMYTYEAARVVRAMSTISGFAKAAEVVGWRGVRQMVLGRKPVTMGTSLTAQLLWLCLKNDVTTWTNASLQELVMEGGKAVGAVVGRNNEATVIKASKGVLLGAGGFAKNQAMREKYQEAPASTAWTSVSPHDHGDAITAAMKIGAATDLLDDAWWGPTIVHPRTGLPSFTLFERALPHSIIVDSSGQRFMNEAQSYTDCGHDQYRRHKEVPAIPAFLIMDQRHRKRYVLAGILPGKPPKDALESGLIVEGKTLADLADKLGIDGDGLNRTVDNFNAMVHEGIDKDFGRGGNAYDRFFGDPSSQYSQNPCLGTIEQGPFYACKIWPGDLGTKGGVVTDAHARALDTDGNVIPHLYAYGNSSASVMGRVYAGAGSTLGPALTFAYLAVDHILRSKGG